MVQKESQMKFFYLAHGIVSYVCLKDLLAKECTPEFVVTHKDYEYEKLKDAFYSVLMFKSKRGILSSYMHKHVSLESSYCVESSRIMDFSRSIFYILLIAF